MSKYGVDTVQPKGFKQGLETSAFKIDGVVHPKTNYIKEFLITIKGKKEKRTSVNVVKGNISKAWKEVGLTISKMVPQKTQVKQSLKKSADSLKTRQKSVKKVR